MTLQITSPLAAIRRLIGYLENSSTPLAYSFFTFISAVLIRNELEGASQFGLGYFSQSAGTQLDFLAHTLIAYFSGVLSLMLLTRAATRASMGSVLRVILPSFILLLLAPCIDLLISGYHPVYQYIGIEPSRHPVWLFLTYFGDYPGISIGMQIEIAIALSGLFIYYYLKSARLLRSLFFTLLSYALIFAYCAAPLIVKNLLFLFNADYSYSSLLIIKFYLLLIFLTGIPVFYYANQTMLLVLMRDMRWLRLSHYLIMLCFGAALAFIYSSEPVVMQITRVDENFLFASISIFFAGLFSIIMNNFCDQDIDRISNPARPLIQRLISHSEYKQLGLASAAAALIYAATASISTLLVILFIMATYFLYSVPPLRFKQVPVFSKLVIAANSLALILLGYHMIDPAMNAFPVALFPIMLIGYTFAANFIDIKDVEGDQRGGIKTLPVLIGTRRAKQLIGFALLLTYLSFYYLIQNAFFLPVLAAGGLIQYYLINRKNYQETAVFVFYFISIALLTALLIQQAFAPQP